MLNDILTYAQGLSAQDDVMTWLNTHLSAYLKDAHPEQTEVEHIVDFLVSDKRPVRISKMSYTQAFAATDKWNKALIKKGGSIKEVANTEDSTAVANNKNSVALARGQRSKVKGKIGAWLVIAEYDAAEENIINIISAQVDGKNILEDTLYEVEEGKFVEASNA